MRQREYAGNVQLTILVAGLEWGGGGGAVQKYGYINGNIYMQRTATESCPLATAAWGGGCGGGPHTMHNERDIPAS